MKASLVVRQVLEGSEKARNNDTDLILRVWYAMGLELTKEQYQKALTLPSAETITRERRALQKMGLYQAKPEVQKTRKQKAERVSEAARISRDAVHNSFNSFVDELEQRKRFEP